MWGYKLEKLKKDGKLHKVLKMFRDEFDKSNFIGHGDDATGFRYKGSVLKLCSKEIGYFKHNEGSAYTFKKNVNKLEPYLLPFDKLLYEDKNVFVYTQPLCERFKRQNMTHKMLYELLKLDYNLLKNRFSSSTRSHNLGIYNGKLVAFDYHDLDKIRSDSIHKQLSSMIEHLVRYVFAVYVPSHYKDYEKIVERYDMRIITPYRKKLPEYFLHFLKYIVNHKKHIEFNEFKLQIKKCMLGEKAIIDKQYIQS